MNPVTFYLKTLEKNLSTVYKQKEKSLTWLSLSADDSDATIIDETASNPDVASSVSKWSIPDSISQVTPRGLTVA
jgi:hypothetical protein